MTVKSVLYGFICNNKVIKHDFLCITHMLRVVLKVKPERNLADDSVSVSPICSVLSLEFGKKCLNRMKSDTYTTSK